MKDYICIIGLDESQIAEIAAQVDAPIVSHMVLPQIQVDGGTLYVENQGRPKFVPVSKVVFHGIYADDMSFLAALALWGGACLPNARAMMDCRLKLPCLVRALEYTEFGEPLRGYVSANTTFYTKEERVAKWGNWHCGENKARFDAQWRGDEPAIIEHFLPGTATRIVIIGDDHWQIRLEGDDWLKSIHHAAADFEAVDADLLEDTRRIQQGFGLELLANDYIVGEAGDKHLLEVNHIPNVTRFPAIWQAYRDYVIQWLQG